MKELETFIEKVEGFDELSASSKIDFFAYFLLIDRKKDGFTPNDIGECFDALHYARYSNIPAYLTKNATGRGKKFLKKAGGRYYIERPYKQVLDGKVGMPALPSRVHSDFFPIELFDNTRGYLVSLANQALMSYNKGIYDGCSVLTRKLIEILIIECFERFGIASKVKNPDGTFFYLSDLIDELLKEPKWTIGRNAKKGLPKIKALGDKSAHNRRFIARQQDLTSVQEDIRTVIEELIHLIDYANWKPA